jgi:chemotaxis protein histidine kinase CheA
MTPTRLLIAPLALACGLFAAPATARADSFDHIDRLAGKLEAQAKSLHQEVHEHFRHTPQYEHLDRDVRQIQRLADAIHDQVRRGTNARALRVEVRALDRVYRHVEELVDDLGRARAIDRQAYRHLKRELDRLGDTLGHLREDLGV